MRTTIAIEQNAVLKRKPDANRLGYGQYFTDHLFQMDYSAEHGWHDPRIVPYGPFSLDPAAMVFHYGQAIFEGMKAYRSADGNAVLFRPEMNARRLNRSGDRLNIPPLDENFFVEAIRTLVRVEQDWIPAKRGASLYIRPFVIATEAALGVRVSDRYLFAVILSPVDAYYEEGWKPIALHVEQRYIRAARGGLGSAKTPANYASGLKAQAQAKESGADQVLWLDALEHTYIEEAGSMNVFFHVDGEVWTPALTGSLLDGVTRDSVLRLLRDWDVPVVERSLSIVEIVQAAESGRLKEAFGTGTAAVIAPIGRLSWDGRRYDIHGGQPGPLAQRLYDTITGIQTGSIADPYGWVCRV